MVRSAFSATLVVGLLCAVPLDAQAPPTFPDHYALTDARIVTAPGRVIPSGTIVIRDGRIAAVGAQVAVPAGAIRMDLSGLTVYPGLIDAATSFGLPSVTGEDAERGAEVMPGRSAADVYDAGTGIEAVRSAGVTTLGLFFDGGIFPGRVAAVNTGGQPDRVAVLRTPVAQQVVLGRRRGGYPGTLMGSVAYVTQAFHDVQYEVRTRQAWERNAAGPRPTYDAEHRALEPAVTGELPVWFAASSERDLGRIVELAADAGVSNYVIVGAHEGYRAVDVLRRAGKPVIVSLDWPSPGQVSGRAFELNVAPVSGANSARDQADTATAQALRGNAAALARAGVTFALSSQGLASPAQLRERTRAAVEAGLPADDALRALTVTPARLLGIESAVGTIEPGKLANLVVTQGDLFARDSRVRHVFVEGVRYEVAAPAARTAGQTGGAAGPARPRVSAAGEWAGEVDGPAGLLEFVLTLAAAGDSLSGAISSSMGSTELRGTQAGNEVSLMGTLSIPSMSPTELVINARVEGTELRGTFSLRGMNSVPFTARRRGAGAGEEVSR